MTLSELLGLSLKSDPVLELISEHGLTVILHADHTHENLRDSYSVAAREMGFELGCDAEKIIRTVWCSLRANDGFRPIDPEIIGIPLFDTIAAVVAHGNELGAAVEMRENVEFLGEKSSWAKILFPSAHNHYEFDDEGLKRVTMMSPRASG